MPRVAKNATRSLFCSPGTRKGVGSKADPWFGPLSAWTWVLGVNLWGVVHGIRAFLPILAEQGQGHIVNTASILGLMPSANPSYDAGGR
ncbi:MAG TPA: SDR family NAD(P)-dependent oxidoreductase [Solirubrobacteraceae bacterium]|nr:SDR family NAD(P)-dependent oxidoreductase [Solirubrobacteraceae bacterium]